MSKTYTKRVWVDFPAKVSVYLQVVDSCKRRWTVVQKKTVKASFENRHAAIAFAGSLSRGEISEKNTDELLIEAARRLDETKPLEGELDARLLGALYYLKLGGGEKGERYLLAGNLAARAGNIPTSESEFATWFEAAFREATVRTHHFIKTRRALRSRIEIFSRMLKQMLTYPIVFKKWNAHIPGALAKVNRLKNVAVADLHDIQSYKPFTKTEIEAMAQGASSFDELLLLIIYLSSGVRSGEGEKICNSSLVGSTLNLSAVVSKTKTSRTPLASTALKVAIRLKKSNMTLPLRILRKQFRPTTASNLLLAGVPTLVVMERLGHASLSMMINHYSKMTPPDWGSSRNSEEYLGIGRLNVGEWSCGENTWDRYVLRLLLVNACRFGMQNEVKGQILADSGITPAMQLCDSF